MSKINSSYLKEKFKSGGVSTEGYKRNSPDINNPYNIIPSNQITMNDVDFPVLGIDDLGNQIMMEPGEDYTFPGSYVTEFPMKNMDNQTFQIGGQKEKYIRAGYEDAKDYTQDYLNSRMYRKMLKKSAGEDWRTMRDQRMQNFTSIPDIGISYDPSNMGAGSNQETGRVYYFDKNIPLEDAMYYGDTFGVHELSHSTDRPLLESNDRLIPQKDLDLISNTTYILGSPELQYLGKPTEVRARLNQIRSLAKGEKIYNPFKSKLNKKQFNRLLDAEYTPLQELQKIYSNDQIYKLLNSVSKAETPVTEVYGQFGLQKNSERFLKNWIKRRKINDPYIQEAYAMDRAELIKRAKNFPSVTTVPEIGGDPYITGRYESNTGRVLRTPDAPPHIITHEQNHYLQDFPNYMRTVHKDIVANELKPVEELTGDYKEMYPYFSSPDEVHSRIMVLREKAGFKPKKPVTEKKLDKFLKGYKGDVDNINDLLEMSKDKKALLNMLNYMAKNDQPTEYYGQVGMQKPIVLEPDYDMYKAPRQGNYLLPDINRPYYIDEVGDKRSEYRIGTNIDGRETLIPTVVGGKQLSEDEALQRYYQTGLHMGMYTTPEQAEYASRLRTAKYNMLQDPARFNASMFEQGGVIRQSRSQVNQTLKYSKQKPNKI
jgi:hypothetical protein